MATIEQYVLAPEQRVVLAGIPWEMYERCASKKRTGTSA